MLAKKIEQVVAVLRAPLSSEEAANGWTPEAKLGILSFFEGLLADVKSKKETGYIGLVRGLDAWGIEPGGALYEKAMQIARELNERSK